MAPKDDVRAGVEERQYEVWAPVCRQSVSSTILGMPPLPHPESTFG